MPIFVAIRTGLILMAIWLVSASAESKVPKLSYSDRGNRFEGRREVEANLFGLEVKSFTAYVEDFKSPCNCSLQVKFYVTENRVVKLEATELLPTYGYAMTAKERDWQPGWASFGPWPTSVVIDSLPGLQASRLGVLAETGVQHITEKSLAPIVLYRSSLPKSVGTYELKFTTKKTLHNYTYYVTGPGSRKVLEDKTVFVNEPENGVITIRLAVSDWVAGDYEIVLEGEFSQGLLLLPKTTIRFHHQPRVSP